MGCGAANKCWCAEEATEWEKRGWHRFVRHTHCRQTTTIIQLCNSVDHVMVVVLGHGRDDGENFSGQIRRKAIQNWVRKSKEGSIMNDYDRDTRQTDEGIRTAQTLSRTRRLNSDDVQKENRHRSQWPRQGFSEDFLKRTTRHWVLWAIQSRRETFPDSRSNLYRIVHRPTTGRLKGRRGPHHRCCWCAKVQRHSTEGYIQTHSHAN